jgi:hypothetical protein
MPQHGPDTAGGAQTFSTPAQRTIFVADAESIAPKITRHGGATSENLGRHCWIEKRRLAWLNRSHRFTICEQLPVDIRKAKTSASLPSRHLRFGMNEEHSPSALSPAREGVARSLQT